MSELSSKPPSLSVALVTRNRPDSLERALKSWRGQSVAPSEIVVSDDSSDPALALACRRLAEGYQCVYTTGPGRGLYANRNHASLACTGSHLLSADDDHTHPPDFVARLMELMEEHADRVWIFDEKDPTSTVPEGLECPGELHLSGHGVSPKDPAHCAAISDGATIYPRAIFDSGLRYDETYRFGALWYLWGKTLARRGWHISFSDRTFIWHWREVETRPTNAAALSDHLEATAYVQFTDAIWVTPSLVNLFWAFAYSARRILIPDNLAGYRIRVRLSFGRAGRAFCRALLGGWRNR